MESPKRGLSNNQQHDTNVVSDYIKHKPANYGDGEYDPKKYERIHTQRKHYQEVKAAEAAERSYQSDITQEKAVPTYVRLRRQKIPTELESWISRVHGPTALRNYQTYVRSGAADEDARSSQFSEQLKIQGIPAKSDKEHVVSLGGDPSKQNVDASGMKIRTPTQYAETVRGSNDPAAQFSGSMSFNRLMREKDSFTKQQLSDLNVPQNWRESASYFLAFRDQTGSKLQDVDFMRLQQGEVTVEELEQERLRNPDRIYTDEETAQKIAEVEQKTEMERKWRHQARKSQETLAIDELTNVHPAFYKTTKLPRSSPEDNYKANILANNPLIPNVKGVKSGTTYFSRIKSHLMSKGFQREAARLAGQSANPFVNIAGDLVGTVYDGLAVAANPKDKKAITELLMSGTQLGTSIVGGALIAIPDPLTGGLGYVIMRAGDRVGQLERLWNMQSEGLSMATNKKLPKIVDYQRTSPEPEPGTAETSLQKDLARQLRIDQVTGKTPKQLLKIGR